VSCADNVGLPVGCETGRRRRPMSCREQDERRGERLWKFRPDLLHLAHCARVGIARSRSVPRNPPLRTFPFSPCSGPAAADFRPCARCTRHRTPAAHCHQRPGRCCIRPEERDWHLPPSHLMGSGIVAGGPASKRVDRSAQFLLTGDLVDPSQPRAGWRDVGMAWRLPHDWSSRYLDLLS
jgi:hypothetical protein